MWSWYDGTEWWQPAVHGGLDGVSETRVVINDKARDDRKWHDWLTGDVPHGVLCAASFRSIVTAIPPTACSPFCWSGWSLIEERCFLYSDQERSYNDSVTYCRLLGSVIASIHSETENAAVTAMIPVGVGKSAYIGAESNGALVAQWYPFSLFWFPKRVPLGYLATKARECGAGMMAPNGGSLWYMLVSTDGERLAWSSMTKRVTIRSGMTG